MSPRRTIASLLLVLQVAGCTRWNPLRLSPEQAVQGRSVLVVLHSLQYRQTVDTVGVPWVRNDSLGGTVADTSWAVPLAAVQEVRTESDSLLSGREPDWGANVALAAGIMMGALIVVIACQDGGCEGNSTSDTYLIGDINFW